MIVASLEVYQRRGSLGKMIGGREPSDDFFVVFISNGEVAVPDVVE